MELCSQMVSQHEEFFSVESKNVYLEYTHNLLTLNNYS